MSLLGNIIWIVFGGFFAWLGYMIAGIAMCLTIVGIPFGMAAFRNGWAMLAPFGKQVVELPNANSPLRLVGNLLWLIVFGLGLAINHLVWAFVLGITIIGLPFAMQHLKLIPIALLPFGRTLR
jgi:uncharacterized membrane protein YccF (DUF307 family)